MYLFLVNLPDYYLLNLLNINFILFTYIMSKKHECHLNTT